MKGLDTNRLREITKKLAPELVKEIDVDPLMATSKLVAQVVRAHDAAAVEG